MAGCQAEYFLQALADGCLYKVPQDLIDEGFPLEVLLLLADVLPTGLSAAWNARRLLVSLALEGSEVVRCRSRATVTLAMHIVLKGKER